MRAFGGLSTTNHGIDKIYSAVSEPGLRCECKCKSSGTQLLGAATRYSVLLSVRSGCEYGDAGLDANAFQQARPRPTQHTTYTHFQSRPTLSNMQLRSSLTATKALDMEPQCAPVSKGLATAKKATKKPTDQPFRFLDLIPGQILCTNTPVETPADVTKRCATQYTKPSSHWTLQSQSPNPTSAAQRRWVRGSRQRIFTAPWHSPKSAKKFAPSFDRCICEADNCL